MTIAANPAVMTTAELIEHLKTSDECVEASLHLNGGLRSTHFLIYDGDTLYDEGCDGEERETTLEEFRNDYPSARWTIDA